MPKPFVVALASLLLLTSPHASASPLAKHQPKFLGSAYGPEQAPKFNKYWNKVTPENAGKWGEVEAVRDQMNWTALDAQYKFAKDHGFPFQMHVMIWGNQQPEWIKTLPVAEQREEIEEWFVAVAARYPALDYVEVVNEPLNDSPSKDDEGGGHYIAALGGNGVTGWDWVIEAFRLGRHYFPHSQLLINDYNITNKPENTRTYLEIIALLQKEKLVDGIGVQAHSFATTTEWSMDIHRANLDALAATGLPIYVTEMDIDGLSDDEQLASYQRVFPVFWEHPGVRGVTLWGYRPGLWREKEGAALVRDNGRERPALKWLRRYVRKTEVN